MPRTRVHGVFVCIFLLARVCVVFLCSVQDNPRVTSFYQYFAGVNQEAVITESEVNKTAITSHVNLRRYRQM